VPIFELTSIINSLFLTQCDADTTCNTKDSQEQINASSLFCRSVRARDAAVGGQPGRPSARDLRHCLTRSRPYGLNPTVLRAATCIALPPRLRRSAASSALDQHPCRLGCTRRLAAFRGRALREGPSFHLPLLARGQALRYPSDMGVGGEGGAVRPKRPRLPHATHDLSRHVSPNPRRRSRRGRGGEIQRGRKGAGSPFSAARRLSPSPEQRRGSRYGTRESEMDRFAKS
jgi:hypothetical protein